MLDEALRDRSAARFAAASFAVAVAALAGAARGTLEDVRKRGSLHCGVSQGLPGFSDTRRRRAHGRASTSISAGPSRRRFFDDRGEGRLRAAVGQPSVSMPCEAGKIDLLSRNSTWTLEREAAARPAVRRHHLS